MNNLLTILGPTASGKTTLAANVAYKINGEIISADSRQVYRNMNLAETQCHNEDNSDRYGKKSKYDSCFLILQGEYVGNHNYYFTSG